MLLFVSPRAHSPVVFSQVVRDRNCWIPTTDGILVSLVATTTVILRTVRYGSSYTVRTVRHGPSDTARTVRHGPSDTARTVRHGPSDTVRVSPIRGPCLPSHRPSQGDRLRGHGAAISRSKCDRLETETTDLRL